MTREDIIRMAREADFDEWYIKQLTVYLERFADLVASAEREKHKWDIHSCSPICNRYACVATREAVLAEREACAKVADDFKKQTLMEWPDQIAEAIRARGQA